MNSSAIFAQLQGVTYSEAIDRYNYLKTRFFVEYSAVANTEERILREQVENDIASEINENPIEGQEGLTESLYTDIARIMANKLEGVKGQRRNIKALYQQSKSKGMKAAAELGELLMPEEELADYVKTSLSSMGIGSGFSVEDIVNQVRSYRNKIILTRTNTSAASYIRSTKGYYREALVYQAFSKLADHLDSMPVISAGAIKNKSGKDTLYDTYISFLNNVTKNFELLVNDNVDVGYGIQSKSWTAPWESDKVGYFNAKYGFSIGSRADLLSRSGLGEMDCNLYTWVKGVQFLEQFAVEAIGENQLGFVTGKNFYWTADLIATFRAMNYFLAFGYRSEKKLSPSVSWQTPPLE